MKLFVTGTQGQVVSALKKLNGRDDLQVVAVGRPDLDLASPANIKVLIEEINPDIVVNAAAYTAVDKAEEERELAFSVNASGAGAVAQAAADLGLPVIHISTDYVFAGNKPEGAYTEEEETNPPSAYGQSKLAGEQAVKAANPRHAILRTAWVYSETGGNFLKTMLRVGAMRDELGVVNDQFGAPTHADAIADGIVKVSRNLMEQPENADLTGLFHMSCLGSTNWHGFATAIFEASEKLGGPTPKVNSITTAEYPLPAPRPANSRLNCDKIEVVHGVIMPHWEVMVFDTVKAVLENTN